MRIFYLLITTAFFIMNTAYASEMQQTLSLSSTSFSDQSSLQKEYTCDGKDISPQIAWRTHR